MDGCYAEKKAIYLEQTEAWNAHKKYLALYRRQVQFRREEERKARAEEDEARRAAWIEEQMKKTPYEEEQNLCDFLVNYLETTVGPKTVHLSNHKPVAPHPKPKPNPKPQRWPT